MKKNHPLRVSKMMLAVLLAATMAGAATAVCAEPAEAHVSMRRLPWGWPKPKKDTQKNTVW